MLNQANPTNALKTIPWFLDLSADSLQRLATVAQIQLFNKGEVIFTEGEQHRNLYVILDGKIQLESFIPGHGSIPIFIGETLDVIGWSSMTPVVRQKTETARVIEDTRLIALEAKRLTEICQTDCDLGYIIMSRLANIVASRFLAYRLHLLELLTCQHG